MAEYLWSKSNDDGEQPTREIQEFLSGDDIERDRLIFEFDLAATAAHARGLARIDVLSDDEANQLSAALSELDALFRSGQYRLDAPFEDAHSAIEHWLTERLGEIGRKVHTGRSRNDQVQTAMRLYLRARLGELGGLCQTAASQFLNRARDGQEIPMPGYTHLQRAVPSTAGLWMASFAESFIDTGFLVGLTRNWINVSPLGTAAGYGVNLELDREGVADELGFDRIQINPMYVQNSRGQFEFQVLCCVAQATLAVRRLAWDLSLFSSSEFGFVRLPGKFATGSSIMPNKSNPDVVELLRSGHGTVQGAISEIQSVLSLPSGYHRDLQDTKAPTIRGTEKGLQMMRLIPEIAAELEFDVQRMRDHIDSSMYATDVTIERVTRQGIPFRDAYRNPISADELAEFDPDRSINLRNSPGACANLCLDHLADRIRQLEEFSRS